jgi:S-adenosylmethionine:tRNA ribosyltransferase-isomerase
MSSQTPGSTFAALVHRGDVVIANDAATLPASLFGITWPRAVELNFGWPDDESLDPHHVHRFTAVAFGAGEFSNTDRIQAAAADVQRG